MRNTSDRVYTLSRELKARRQIENTVRAKRVEIWYFVVLGVNMGRQLLLFNHKVLALMATVLFCILILHSIVGSLHQKSIKN
jgi:hypothetical protein